MKIFLPFKQDLNPYLEEITKDSVHEFVYNSWKNYQTSYPIVNIHWPEAIFDWEEPDEHHLKELDREITKWKKKSTLVYTKHDFERNKGTTKNFTRLFKLIEENTDVFIHLGKLSKELYQDKYTRAEHEIIYHPLYKNTFKKYEKSEARKRLGIDEEAVVVIAPGNIRHAEERRMVLQAFKNLDISNKSLICTNMRNELEFEFPGRVRLQNFFDAQRFVKDRFVKNHQPPQYFFNYSSMTVDDISLRMSAADIVFIPRIDILNSGIVFLAANFDKVTVGPVTGNITEHLKEQNLPVFNPNSISSVAEALRKGIDLFKSGNFQWKNMEKHRPQFVAKEYDRVFSSINND